MSNFKKLRVWEMAHELGVDAYRISIEMQTSYNRDLCDQLRRSSASIAANIAEADAHESPLEKARYLQYSIASASETENHIEAARDINSMSYVDFRDLSQRIVSVRRMLHRLIQRVRARIPASQQPRKRTARDK